VPRVPEQHLACFFLSWIGHIQGGEKKKKRENDKGSEKLNTFADLQQLLASTLSFW